MNPKRKWWDEVFKDETEKEGWKNTVGNANLIVKRKLLAHWLWENNCIW